ncbi:uncharacterized protein LOC141717545 [Apium graveolens]|uniref:uncharacterized protein LOC141717545 n=1 Tax=Apium graveolens TaxID=4045 RepID=UPI003D7BCC26
MEDHVSDSLVEEREDVMHPPSSGKPTLRKAHFLKPVFKQHFDHPPPKPTFQELKRYKLRSNKRHPFLEMLKKCKLRSYKGCTSEKWKIWVEKLRPRYQEIWKQAGIYEAILASTYAIPKDKNLIIGLAERWCGETNTCIFPWGEVSITLEDNIYLGNFSVLGDSFSTPLPDELVGILDCLNKVHIKVRRSSNGHVGASVWMKYNMRSGNQFEHEAFLAMWLSKSVFACSRDHIAAQDFCVAIHLSRGTRIALAPVVLASIYRDMRLLHNSILEFVNLESVVGLTFSINQYDLVQMWVWERFPELRPAPNVREHGEPRWARWKGATILDVEDVGEVLDSSKESFVWCPYCITPSNCVLSKLYKDNEQWLVFESDDQEVFARCLRVSELVGLGYIEQYSPHRVAMQFVLDQDVPANVIRSNKSSETAWSSYNRSIRGIKLYIPPRHFESDISSGYVAWWRNHLVFNEEVVTNGIQKEKQLPLVSYLQEKDECFLSSTGWLSVCAAKRPEDRLSIDQLLSRQRKTGSSGRSNDHEPVLNIFSRIETPAKEICMTEPVGHVMPVNEEVVTDSIQIEKQLPLVSYGQKKNAKSSTSTGCLSGCAAERQEDSLAIDLLMNRSRMTESSMRRNDHEPVKFTFSKTKIPKKVICMTEPVGRILAVNEEMVTCGHKRDLKSLTIPGCISGCAVERPEDDEEDSLTITQILSRERKTESSAKRNDLEDEPLSNTYSKIETPTKLMCVTEPVQSNVRSLSSSGKCKNGDSPAESKKESEARKGAVVSEANHTEVNKDTSKLAKEEAVSKANIVMLEESYDHTASASQLPQLGLEARILRLETIINMIKAEKYVSSSRKI